MVTFSIDPARTALLIVDLQRCFVDDSPVAAPDGPAVVRSLNELAATCRERGVSVIHTRHVVRPDHSNAGLLAEVVPAVAYGVIDDGSPTAGSGSEAANARSPRASQPSSAIARRSRARASAAYARWTSTL